MAIQIETTTQAEQLLATIGTIPAAFHTNYQRVSYLLSILRSHADQAIAQGAKSLYDGSISKMARCTKTSSAAYVVAQVLERAEHFRVFPAESAQEWAASLDPVGLPSVFDDDPDPEPTTPASAPVPQYGDEDAFERFCTAGTFWRQYDQALPHILNHWDALCDAWREDDDLLSDEAMDFIESDEYAEWLGYPQVA